MIWASVAAAAPVVCDPVEAERLVRDAYIDVQRVPVTHPWLVPGLARNAAGSNGIAEEIASLCDAEGQMQITYWPTDQHGEADWSAYVVLLTVTRTEGCGLVHRTLPLSVGIGPGGPRYSLRGAPTTRFTPKQGCPDPATERREELLAGAGTAVRLVLIKDIVRNETVETHVAVRTATAAGWTEQIIASPAPPRLLDPTAPGPTIALAQGDEGAPLIVRSGDRTPSPCRALGGQTVWRSTPIGWKKVDGRDALTLLARKGLWRYAGDDGWLLILAQDDEEDIDLVRPRRRRLRRRDPEELYLLYSADFPGLYAGYVVITPGPWPTEAAAQAARGRWKRAAFAYVKRAWVAPDPCGVDRGVEGITSPR